MMTNGNRQKLLNTEKYLASQKAKEDLSGKMWWCIGCPKQMYHHSCSVSQKEKDEKFLCAINFNKRKKINAEDNKH